MLLAYCNKNLEPEYRVYNGRSHTLNQTKT